MRGRAERTYEHFTFSSVLSVRECEPKRIPKDCFGFSFWVSLEYPQSIFKAFTSTVATLPSLSHNLTGLGFTVRLRLCGISLGSLLLFSLWSEEASFFLEEGKREDIATVVVVFLL